MRLKYGILWFEDREGVITRHKVGMEEYLRKLGFEPNIIDNKNGEDWEEILEKQEINLILVDQNLVDKKGKEIISKIREAGLFTEIVFYSYDPAFLKDIKENLEGVYTSLEPTLLDKTKKIIDITIRKNQDICNIRGLFIAETIDIASQMEEIISIILKLENDPKDFFIYNILQDRNFPDDLKFRVIKYFLEGKSKELEEKIDKTSSSDEKASLELLKNKLKGIDKVIGTINTDVLNVRNELAHSKPNPEQKNCLFVKDRKLRLFDESECIKIRGIFLKHSNNLSELEEILKKLP